ncbi:MAG: lipopolysaccharide heptosyltransferase II [Terrimicrobiaceae bacterium]
MTDRFVYWLVLAFVSLIRLLPLKICFLLGRGVGLGLWAVLPGYRRLARENIYAAYGGAKTKKEAAHLAREHFATLGANGISSLKIPLLSQSQIKDIAPIEGLDNIRDAVKAGRGVVLAINHIGNWELYAQLVFQVPEARFGTVYQALRNPLVDELINRDRRRLGVLTFDRKKGFNDAIALIREPGVLGVLVDQNAGDGGMWMPFFGRLSSTSTLAAKLALRTGADVVPVAIHTSGFARWKVVVGKALPTGSTGELTLAINAKLESQIRESPADWFWVHNRWKTPSPNFLTVTQRRGTYLPPGFDPASLRPFRMVIRSPNWLGDAVMSVQAARAFKLGRPDARLCVLAPAKLVAIWQAVPEVDEVLEIPPKASVFAVARLLRREFDVAVLFPNSVRSALEAWLAGIPRIVGFPNRGRNLFLNQPIKLKRRERVARPLHHADRYRRIAAKCGALEPPDPQPKGSTPTADPPVLAVCPGAEYGPAKRWPAERFRAVMDIVSSKLDCEWKIYGAKGDRAVAEEICEGFSGRVENLAGRTSIEELMAGLSTSRALLTNDTGTMHLADLLGVPLVAVFGSTEPLLTGPRGARSVTLRHQVECSPCFLRVCPLDFRCMKGITPEAAASALMSLLDDSSGLIFPRPPLNTGGNIS